VFYKTITAYRTGLDMRPVDRSEAAEAWVHHRQYGDASEKVIRDYLFVVASHKARQHRIPFQVHTGHTSHVNVWPQANPILLTPILNSGAVDGTTLVLVHGGYPFCTEAGYLTSVYPDIYVDLSLIIPWASVGITSRILQILEAAPTAKVMYGSDGISVPELHWIGSIVTRRAFGIALDQLIAAQFVTNSEAEEIAHDVFHRTARRVYRLPSD
jgi:predicted TIM-barrel fold metal-dependent hydrolase